MDRYYHSRREGTNMPYASKRKSAVGWQPALFNAGRGLSQGEYQYRRDITTTSELAKYAFLFAQYSIWELGVLMGSTGCWTENWQGRTAAHDGALCVQARSQPGV